MQYHNSLRLVLDTSVIVAAFRSSSGASNWLLRAALDRKFTLLLSVPLMLEYESVLGREEHLSASGLTVSEVNAVLDALAATGEPVRLPFHWRPMLRDANDDMVLEAAANGRADGLVTFNRKDFVSGASGFGIRVLLPQEALRMLEEI
ncbi:MAG TPA: putative toxin-antitoxin system toxin component, PIN family [Acidobacteriaceae bacterium]|jgi:putative PIN family toxin of toxin-antitoxin system